MAFEKTPTKIPTAIGLILVTLKDPDGVNTNRSIMGRVQVLDQNNEFIFEWTGDVGPQLTTSQLTALKNFMDSLRAKAIAEIL